MPLHQMGETIFEITKSNPEEIAAPQDVIIESEIAERVVVDYENVRELGEKSIYACPDCGGGLWDIPKQNARLNDPDNYRDGQGESDRYRCHIGHSYSEKDLVVKQGEVLESTLWTALRIMEERRNLLKKMEDDNNKKGLSKMAASYQEKGEGIQIHVDRMKDILFATQKTL
jgi:two-component system chemotaxis response regulator CheB